MDEKFKYGDIKEILSVKGNVNYCTEEGKCSGCGNCCGNVLPITKIEIATIKQYIKKHKIKPIIHGQKGTIDCMCPFRDEVNKKCIIYSVRPFICRDYQCNKDPMQAAMDMYRKDVDPAKYTARDMRRTFFKCKEDEQSKAVHDMMLLKANDLMDIFEGR